MKKFSLFSHFFLSKFFLVAPAVVIIGVAVSITFRDILFLLSNIGLSGVENVIKGEETLATILIGFGVLVKGRGLFFKKVMRGHKGSKANMELNEVAEYYGYIISVVGVAIEIIDVFAAHFGHHFDLVLVFETGFGLSLNFLAVGYLLILVKSVLRVEGTVHLI